MKLYDIVVYLWVTIEIKKIIIIIIIIKYEKYMY